MVGVGVGGGWGADIGEGEGAMAGTATRAGLSFHLVFPSASNPPPPPPPGTVSCLTVHSPFTPESLSADFMHPCCTELHK